jgi:aspartyl-tRNA(Asn)/glutamyl-tRNA(Gln) amidotransferase subunit B
MRLVRDFELKTEDAEVFIYNQPAGAFFEDVVSHLFKSKSSESKIDKAEKITKNEAGKKLIKLAANYIISDYLGLLKNESRQDGQEYLGKISGEHFAELVSMIGEGKLGSRAAKDILMIMHTEGGRASEIAAARGLLQKSDEGELKRIMSEVVAANPKVVADYKAGKVAALQSLIGQGMKATKGSANPELLRKIASDLLG